MRSSTPATYPSYSLLGHEVTFAFYVVATIIFEVSEGRLAIGIGSDLLCILPFLIVNILTAGLMGYMAWYVRVKAAVYISNELCLQETSQRSSCPKEYRTAY